ncbi:hypothetical protein [Streptomyces niveiscabiei]|uniref:Uncharacterized protein n=1 Tax=Streptomyces niveiscabiei TaxID=164115 RepID=A0ABW9HZG1_9ACTN
MFGLVLPDLPGSMPVEVTWPTSLRPRVSRSALVWCDRRFAIEDTPAAGGKVTYTLCYPGDAAHAPATARSPSRATGGRREEVGAGCRGGKLVLTCTRRTTFTAVFGGDARPEPAQATTPAKPGRR